MYLEAKAVITTIGLILIFIGLSQIILVIPFVGILILMGVFMFVFGDILLGIKITKTKAYLWFDPLKNEEELNVMQTITGILDLVVTKKAPLGKREFVYHKQEASVINNGRGNFHTINGNPGFYGHEGYDQNIDPVEAKALEQLKGDTIEEVYENIIGEREGEEDDSR